MYFVPFENVMAYDAGAMTTTMPPVPGPLTGGTHHRGISAHSGVRSGAGAAARWHMPECVLRHGGGVA